MIYAAAAEAAQAIHAAPAAKRFALDGEKACSRVH